MAFEQKDNTGALFKNDKREKDGDPQATGQAMINGVEYWLSAWTNDGQKGKWQKLTFKRKDAARSQTMYSDDRRQPDDVRVEDDTIPF